MFKILKGFDDVDYREICVVATNSLRGHSLKLVKERFNTNLGKFLFSNRVVDEWNSLSEDIVSCDTVNGFKGELVI